MAEARKILMRGGHEIRLDGDLLGILESLYREVSVRSEFRSTYENMMQEIRHIVDSMDERARRSYLIESLFLNIVTYENERLAAYVRKFAEANDGED